MTGRSGDRSGLFGGSTLRFAVATILGWCGSMAFVYALGGAAAINEWSALGGLAGPGIWVLYRCALTVLKR